jgi:DNA sulfur modification protein DndD
MLLQEVHLYNVGLYRGEQSLRFSSDTRRPITLIGGRNGTGKTTLLDAIPLALYGSRSKHMLGIGSYPEYLNALIHADADEASISLTFDRWESGSGARYVLKRRWSRTSSGRSLDHLTVRMNDVDRPDLAANWPQFVEGIMPLSVSGLAVFDGEKIERLADASSSADLLRTALRGLLGLDLVEQLRKDLADYRRRLAHDMPNVVGDVESRLDAAEVRLASAESALLTSRDELNAANEMARSAGKKLSVARERLSQSGGELYDKREQLQGELVAAEANASVGLRRLEALVSGDLPLLMVTPLVQQVARVGRRARMAEEASLLLERMKERDERLLECFEHESIFDVEQVKTLSEILTKDRSHYETHHEIPYHVSPEAASASADFLRFAGGDLTKEVAELVESITADRRSVHSLRRTLASVPDGETIAFLVKDVTVYERDVTQAEELVQLAEDQIREAERRCAASQREVDRLACELIEEGADDRNAGRIAREISKADEALKRYSSRIIESSVNEICRHITDSLHALLRKQELIVSISIDPTTLVMELEGGDGQVLDPVRLSAGERQMLATAVLWGLSKATGRVLPTIIDTPVGRLDTSHRTNLVDRYFPSAASQVVLLSTDEEIVGDYLKRLESYVGQRYLLSYDETQNATTITEGYFK